MTEPRPQSEDASEPTTLPVHPDALVNPDGQVAIQPIPWSYQITKVRVGGDPRFIAIIIYDHYGKRVLMCPAQFAMGMAEVIKAHAMDAMGGLAVPSEANGQSGLILPPGVTPGMNGS